MGLAATNPVTSGITSQGSIVVSITKGNIVRISQLADMPFPAMPTMAANTTINTNVCIFSTSGAFNILGSSPNSLGIQTRLRSGANYMNYVATFSSSLNTFNITHGVATGVFTGAETVNELCSGGTNATLSATITAANFNAAPQGAYSDTLTLLFSPQ